MSSVQEHIYDIGVIGAGPAGLTAAIFARNKNLQTLIIEGLEAGGQLRHLYPFKPVYNFPGYSVIDGGKLADSIINQVHEKGIQLFEYEPVSGIERTSDELFHIKTVKQTIQSRSIVLSAGMGLLQPRRLDVPGETELEDSAVFYAIKDPDNWYNRDIAVLGGGNSAVDNALMLHHNGSRVTLIHNLDKFQAEEGSVEKLMASGAGILTGTSVVRFEQVEKCKIKVFFRQGREAPLKSITVDRALINIGLKPDLGFLNDLDINKKGRQLVVDTEMQTSLPGIFACGDVVTYPGKVRLIVTAVGEAATAVNRAEQYLKSLTKSRKSHDILE